MRLVAVDLRGAVLAAAVCGGVLVTAFTELLSLVGGLTLGWLLVAWATALAAAGLLLARLRVFRQPRPPSERPSLPRSLDLAIVVWIAMAVALTGALALSAVPINYDSMTKGTSYVFAAPFVLVFVLMGRGRPLSTKLTQGLVIGLCAVALNAPQYWRNAQLFGSPLGPGAEGSYRYANDAFSPAILASNVLRNLGVHAGTPWPAANAQAERAIAALHQGIGIALDDPRSTWPGMRFEVISPVANEDLAGNGLHLLLIAAAMVGAWRRRRDVRLHAFAGCLIAAFLVFCLLLRWQPWHSRLQLPLFVLATPLVGVVFEGLKPTLLAIALFLFGGSSVYFLTGNKAQPVMGRRAVFSTARAEQRAAHAGPAYVGAARFVVSMGCRQVGLAMAGDDREYLLWGLLADAGWRGRIEPLLVANVSSELPKPSLAPFRPCAILRVGLVANPKAGTNFEEQYYGPGWSQEGVQVLVPALKPVAAAAATTGPPGVSLALDRTLFRPGDRMTIGLDARNPVGGAAADLFVGIVLPDGRSAVFVGPAGFLSELISLADASAYPRAAVAPPGFALSEATFIELPLPDRVPRGRYKVFATLVKSRASRGPSIPPADLLASDMRDVVVSSDRQDSGGSPSR